MEASGGGGWQDTTVKVRMTISFQYGRARNGAAVLVLEVVSSGKGGKENLLQSR